MYTVPRRWKCPRITPVFKGGDPTDMNCYRPISALPLLSTVLERHAFDALYDFLTSNNLISHQQSGFRDHHSCQSLLIKITDYFASQHGERKNIRTNYDRFTQSL